MKRYDFVRDDIGKQMTVKSSDGQIHSGTVCHMDSTPDLYLMIKPYPELKTYGPLSGTDDVLKIDGNPVVH